MIAVADRARQLLKVHGVKQKDAAVAMHIHETAVSKIIAGTRGISADEFMRLEAYVAARIKSGFAEAPADFNTKPAAGSPVYPSRATAKGEWAVDLAAPPLHFAEPPAPQSKLTEVYGFPAPDASAWPRYKTGETVWVSPSQSAAPGDDAFIVRTQNNKNALRGMIGELQAQTPKAIQYRDFATGEMRHANAAQSTVYRIAARSA